MVVIGVLWLAVALAGEAELAVERGRVALELQDMTRARSQALRALSDTPTLGVAQDLYVDATAAGGLGTLGATELVLYERDDPDWLAHALTLDEALQTGDYKTIRDATAAVLVAWPDHPDLLLPLWTKGEVDRKTSKLRDRVIKATLDPKALIGAEAEELYRLRRLLKGIEPLGQKGSSEGRDVVEARLEELGEPTPPKRDPLSRMGRIDLAHQMSKESVPALPWGYPSELVDVVDRLARTWEQAGRHRHTALAWSQLQRVTDDPKAWTGEAKALLLEGDVDKALRAANDAVLQATKPQATDLAALATDRQRRALAGAWLVQAKVHEANGDTRMALASLGLANLMAEEVLDDRLGERLDDAATPLFTKLEAQYRRGRQPPFEVALAMARGADDRDEAVAHLNDALFLMTQGTNGATAIGDGPDFYAPPYAELLHARAEVEKENGRVDQGRSAIMAATLLVGKSRPWWWKLRGELQQDNGETDAAFASFAVARGLGVRDLGQALQDSYVGPASWEVAANDLGGPEPEEEAPPPSEAVTLTASVGTGRKGPGKARPKGAPRLGERFPSFSVNTGYGVLNNRSLEGRIVVVTFWDSDCGECLQLLPSFGSVARRLRKEGIDTVMIAVSADDDASDFEKVYRVGQRWGELVHEPALAREFGVERMPTTWVVDRSGVARYFVDHWFSAEELEAQVRQVTQ